MPLILQKSFSEMSREQIEEHLTQVRARRMLASMEYHAGQNLKLERESNVLHKRIATQYELLGREINRLDELDSKIQDRLNRLSGLLQETAVISELLST